MPLDQSTSANHAVAESVVSLASYLEELKAEAAGHPIDEITRRGYLRPDEELALRRLQVSYWHSRNALFETIVATQPERAGPDRKNQGEFLIAFAAAVLLVDVARFLRVQFHRSAPIRQKLNEPDRIYGVPDLMYHRVQRSLTSPHHAWQLLQARRTYKIIHPQLVEYFQTPPWSELLAIADRLEHCLRPSWWTYLRTRLRVRGRQVARRLGRDIAGQAVYRLQMVVSHLLSEISVHPGHKPSVPSAIHKEIAAQLQPGDVFVIRKEYAATNYFLPGYWPHAALHIGDPQPETKRVLEALKDGVRLRSIDSPLASDSVVVLRPKLSPQQIATALARAMQHEGKPYDFDFDFSRSDRLVCTEVVYRAFDGIGEMKFELERHVGRPALGAVSLVRSALLGQNFRPLLVYSPEDATGVVTGEKAEQILRARCQSGSSSDGVQLSES